MVIIRFTNFALGLLFVVHALRDSSAYAHQGEEELVGTGNNVAVQKELLDGANTAGWRKIGIGGRKMAVHKVWSKEIKRGEGLDGGTSEISGKDSNALKKSPGRFQDEVNNQNNINMLEAKTSKSGTLGLPNTNPEKYFQDSKTRLESSSRSDDKPVISQETYDTAAQREESETHRLLEETKEIVKLMHKDYGGMARRKPPINNNEPRH